MTLNQRQIGYTASLRALERSPEPVVVNEFLWWWFDNEWHPTSLMKDVVERWLGRSSTTDQIIERQQYLAEELVGLFRRMRCAAIQPFVYLSNNRGPTAHWFEGPIADLKPKPILQALKNAFAPFGVSLELWDRHYVAGQTIALPVHVFNDYQQEMRGTLEVVVKGEQGETNSTSAEEVSVPSGKRTIVRKNLSLPTDAGCYTLQASVSPISLPQPATSTRKIYVFESGLHPVSSARQLFLSDPSEEVESFVKEGKIPYTSFGSSELSPSGLFFVNTFGIEQREYIGRLGEITEFLNGGGVLIVQEPEFRTVEPKELRVSQNLTLRVERRIDVDKGGYDSYVFPEDPAHPLWQGLRSEHFQWFNGAPGGEIVSEYSITPSLPFVPLASCGLGLRIPAVMAIYHGKGMVIVSRIQVRGRLLPSASSQLDHFSRRPDPVAQRYLFNLIAL